MPTPQLIGRPAKDTSAELKSRPGRPRRLPDDLLRQASRRLGIMALIAAGLWLVAPVLGHLAFHATHPGDPEWARLRPNDVVAATSFVLSLALFLYLRARDRDPGFVIDLSLWYLVISAFAIGVVMHAVVATRGMLMVSPTITWTGTVMLIFAAIVPVPPRSMLVAGFLAASMDPVGMVLWRNAGLYDFGPLSNVLVMHYPNYLLLGVAVVISHVVARLGQQVSRERELGSYHLGELLGRGGMGEVYQATHRMLARPAAIKLIRAEVLAASDRETTKMVIARFRREAQAAANLDERGIVWQLDPGTGRILKRFGLAFGPGMQPFMGKRPKPEMVTGDFEDIQIVGERFFLLSSNGFLVEFREGRDGERVPFRAFDTGLAPSCELEGLTYDASTRSLLLLCKHPYRAAWRHQVVVLGWSVETRRLDPVPRLRVSEKRVARLTGVEAFHGSAMGVAPGSGALILVAGPQRRIIEISPTGELLAGRSLKAKLHRQPEGLAFAPDRTLLISDEAAGGRATLTAYAYRP